MNYEEFMKRLQEYYGSYESDKVPGFVMSYLKRDIEEKNLGKLFRYIAYSHPIRFGAPGISDIEKAISESLKNNKGVDAHKTPSNSNRSEELKEISDEEREEVDDMLKEKGGIMGILKESMPDKPGFNVIRKGDE